jgi:anti-sigma factor RsiW
MNHQRIQEKLSAYLDNELTPIRHKQIEAHLRSCDECADMLSAFQKNRQMIANIAHPVPSTLKDGVMAKIHTQFQDELSAYLDNELAPAMRGRMEAHLHSCDECSDMLAAFHQNREQIQSLEHPAPSSIENTVMAKIRQQAAQARKEEPARAGWIPDIGRWMPDLGRWFFRPVTAGATGVLTLVLILGALYFYPTTPQYEETLDFYFGLYTEQLVDNTFDSNTGISFSTTSTEDALSTETADDTEELFLDLYLENVGN